MKVTIFSFAVNDKFPIDLQYKQFQKNIREDFEFILINDAFTPEMTTILSTIAKNIGVKCVCVPQEIHKIHNPSVGYADALNWLVKTYVKNKNFEIIMIVHADIFPLQLISIEDIIKNYTIASTMEYRMAKETKFHYIYPALTLINIKTVKDIDMLNFDCGKVDNVGLDTGGMTYSYINKYTNDVRFIEDDRVPSNKFNFGDRINRYLKYDYRICKKHKLNDGWFAEGLFHYVAGSQWNISDISLDHINLKECPDDGKRLIASSYIKKWYRYYNNKKRVIGNRRRIATCVGLFG